MAKHLIPLLLLLPLIVYCLVIGACGDDDDSDDEDDTPEDPFADDDDAGGEDDSIYMVDPVIHEAPPWPEWVLRHWVWEDESTQETALALVDDYLANDIPVGAIIIDSPWETGYNTFDWDLDMYPEPQDMIDAFHENNVRVFMWITPNVNEDSPNFQEGLDAGYYVNNGETLEWWKGDGAFIDYNNPDALEWWHKQMDKILDMNIDGWKTDGSAFLLWLSGMVETYTGTINPHEYQALYYRDFFYYTREKLGNDRVITSRPVDSYGVPFWGPTFAPKDVCLAGWVGDQDPDWLGLRGAMINIRLSAERGYVNFGSDIGGYRGDDIREKDLFIRWAQFGAFCPIMENGGAGEHRPWMYDDQTLSIYREYVNVHHSLIPYLYSQGAESYVNDVSLMRYIDGTFDYYLGGALFVAPIQGPVDARDVAMPSGTWYDFFTGEEYAGNTTHNIAVGLDDYPVFVRKGAIIPLNLGNDSVFSDVEGNLPPLTAMIYPNQGQRAHFNVYEEFGTGARIEAEYGDRLKIKLTATERQYAFVIKNALEPVSVKDGDMEYIKPAQSMDEMKLVDSGWYYSEGTSELWIKPGSTEFGVIVYVE